jgi:ABC-2 type transport system permease protein
VPRIVTDTTGAAGTVPNRLADMPLRVVSRRPKVRERIQNVWSYNELLRNLVRKELRVRYKGSVLGFLWTLLNPALYLVVFSIVFKFILQSQVPYFAVFLLSGLVVWNFFSAAISGGCSSIIANASLVQRVWLPREVLPMAPIGASLMHFFFQLTVLAAALAIFRRAPDWQHAPLLVLGLVVLLVFTTALAVGLSVANVHLRDTQHLLELVLLAWFWLSTIVYPYEQVATRLGDRAWVLLLNPIIPVILAFQRVIYNPAPGTGILPDEAGIGWYYRNLALVGLGSVVLLWVALWFFSRLEDNLAEEI